jgi:hypothetical protein
MLLKWTSGDYYMDSCFIHTVDGESRVWSLPTLAHESL